MPRFDLLPDYDGEGNLLGLGNGVENNISMPAVIERIRKIGIPTPGVLGYSTRQDTARAARLLKKHGAPRELIRVLLAA